MAKSCWLPFRGDDVVMDILPSEERSSAHVGKFTTHNTRLKALPNSKKDDQTPFRLPLSFRSNIDGCGSGLTF